MDHNSDQDDPVDPSQPDQFNFDYSIHRDRVFDDDSECSDSDYSCHDHTVFNTSHSTIAQFSSLDSDDSTGAHFSSQDSTNASQQSSTVTSLQHPDTIEPMDIYRLMDSPVNHPTGASPDIDHAACCLPSTSQMGGAVPQYQVLRESERHIQRFRATERTQHIKMNVPQPAAGANLPAFLEHVGGVVEDICQNNLGGLDDDDFVRVVIDSHSLKHSIFASLLKKKHFSSELVLSQVERVGQSNDEFPMDDTMTVMFTNIRQPRGGKASYQARHVVNLEKARRKWRCIVQVMAGDNLCLPAAVCLGKALCDHGRTSKEYISRYNQKSQINLTLEAAQLYNVCLNGPVGQPCRFEDLQAFQNALPNYRIIVFGWAPKEILWRGPAGAPECNYIYLLYDRHESHFDLIAAPSAFLNYSYFCHHCLKGYDQPKRHRCSKTCFDKHKLPRVKSTLSLCEDMRLCGDCGRWIDANDPRRRNRPHTCGEVYCKGCWEFFPPNQLCYIRSTAPSDEEKSMEADVFQSHRIVYYDVEAYPDENGVHVPNLFISNNNKDGREEIFYNVKDFCLWALSEVNHGATFVAHYAKGYDTYFVISWLLEHCNEKLNPIMTGSKILMLEIPIFKIRFIDSLSFISAPLCKLPKMFGLDRTLKKGFFPHAFNRPENYDYCDVLPISDYYGPDGMSDDRRREFLDWHATTVLNGYEFNFWDELISYCREDVHVLMDCCEMFRKDFFETSTVDPFWYMTVASACNAVWRKLDVPRDTVGVIPAGGYAGRDKQSHAAIEWLCWKEHVSKIPIRHARNGHEIEALVDKGKRFKLDGVYMDDPRNLDKNRRGLEFAGCYIHGCLACSHAETFSALRQKTMGELNDDFSRRNTRLAAAGWDLEIMWQCQWETMKRNDPEIVAFLAALNLQSPLDPRDGFYGGRTNASCLYYQAADGEEIRYLDFTSLYPFVNKNRCYPVGHPEIILGTEIDLNNLDDYFNMVKCDILPPTNEWHPPLAHRFQGKCMFALCRTCAETSQKPPCRHTEDERVLRGTWTTVDIQDAVRRGYRVFACHEIWHYNETSDDLFSSYMNRFLKVKVHAGGFPALCDTDEKKVKFVDDYSRVEGVELDMDKMVKNPSMYTVSKLYLNTLWGKFGQRQNLGVMKMINSEEEFWRLLLTDGVEITAIQFYGERYAQVSYKEHDELCTPGLNTNVVIACFTTAYARRHLRHYLTNLDDRVLYYDTDSIIFVHRPGEYCPPTGEFLGEFKNEHKPGQFGVELLGAGPKNYGLKLNTGETTLKVRGFTLNALAQQDLNYGVVRQQVKDGGFDMTRTIKVGMGDTIKRRKSDWSLYTLESQKTYQLVYNKRYILDHLQTVPWGFLFIEQEVMDV